MIRTSYLINVSKGLKREKKLTMEVESMSVGATKVLNNKFDRWSISISRLVHELTSFINSEGQVRQGEGNILQSIYNLTKFNLDREQ